MTSLDPGKLADCPFCGAPLTLGGGVNPWGRCDTPECWMNERKLVIPLDEPTQITAWNTRAFPSLQDEDDLVRRLRERRRDSGWATAGEAADMILALRMRVATVRALAIEEVCAAISEQIGTQRVIMRAIRDRREKEIDAARLVGLGDAILIAKALSPTLEIEKKP
jgi:hypothetical protein